MGTLYKFCEQCAKKNNPTMLPGFWDYDSTKSLLKENMTECFQCGSPLIDTCFNFDECVIISHISTDTSFIKAMDQLKQDNPIEFQLKMAQFKNQVQQQKSVASSSNKPKCPTCGSTNIKKISGTKRWLSTGLFGLASSNIGKSMYCQNCGYKW